MIKENGILRILYLKEFNIFPLNISRVERPIPQPGHGIPVTNLNTQCVLLVPYDKLSRKNNVKYPPTIATIASEYLAVLLCFRLICNLSKREKVFLFSGFHY